MTKSAYQDTPLNASEEREVAVIAARSRRHAMKRTRRSVSAAWLALAWFRDHENDGWEPWADEALHYVHEALRIVLHQEDAEKRAEE